VTTEERQEIKSIIVATLSESNADNKAEHAVISTKLDGIDTHLKTQNSTIAKHEKQINSALEERSGNRQKQEDYFKEIDDMREDVSDLKKDNITAKTMKRFNARLFTISTVVLSLFLTIIGLWIKHGIQ